MHLKEEDITRIENAIRKAEKECQAEVVPVLVGRSDDYPGARWRLAILFSLSVSFFIPFIFENISPSLLILSQFFTLYLGHLLGTYSPLFRLFLAKYKIKEEVHQRALKAFWDTNIHQTKRRTGILILVSLLEHRAEILTDIGIAKKVEQKDWDHILKDLLKNLREKNWVGGLEKTILSCGQIVKEKCPQETKQELKKSELTEQKEQKELNELSNTFLYSDF